jgi:predicted cobalt transporter CbtA
MVDPFKMSITEADLPDLSYKRMKQLIGAEYIDRTGLGGMVYAYIDDTGLKKSGQRFWHFEGSLVLMAGFAIIVGVDDFGDPTELPPYATLDFTKRVVAFLGDARGAERAIEKGLIQRPRTKIHTVNGGALKSETIWQWDHRECLDAAQEGGAA